MDSNLVEKVRKLLALADSPNENEAALAAEKAQELMLRYGIEMAQVHAASGNDRKLSVDEAQSRGKTTPWRTQLANSIAKSMGGRIVYVQDYGVQSGTIHWFGPAGTVESMMELYRYLENTLVSISAIETARREETWIHGKTYRSSFLKGAVSRIARRLSERYRATVNEDTGDNSKALVVIKGAVDSQVAERFPRLRSRTVSSNVNYDAYRKGQQAGSNVSLGDNQIGNGRGALPVGR